MRLVVIAGLIMGGSLAILAWFGAQARAAEMLAADTTALRVRAVWFFNANRERHNATIGGFATEQDCQLGADLVKQSGEATIRSTCFARAGKVTIDMPVD